MTIFVIRNYISVHSAEGIIKQYKITDACALVVNRNDTKGYETKIKALLDSNSWTFIGELPMYYSQEKQMNKLKNVITNHVLWFSLQKEVFSYLYSLGIINSIFITSPAENLEKIVYRFGKCNNIPVNSFEEGFSHYSIYDERLANETSVIKKIVRRLLYFSCPYFLRTANTFIFNDVYCFLPECYRKKDYTGKLYPIETNFKNKIGPELIGTSQYDVLLITDPLFEDGCLTYEEDFELMKKIVDFFKGKKILYKPHPREKKEKINRYATLLNIYLIDSKLNDFAAEAIVESLNIKNIAGVHSSTLVYESVLNKGVKVYSFLESLREKHLVFQTAYEDLKDFSSNIIFL